MIDLKKIPIGMDNFKDIIQGNYYYVDKTKMIEEILERGSYITLFPRPRRFGKSLMISTIDEFFNCEKKQENKNTFKGLYIEKTRYKKEQGKYPVIKVNLKSLKAENWEDMYKGIEILMQSLYSQFYSYRQEINAVDQYKFDRIAKREADSKELEQGLLFLSKILYEKYHEKVILLIDEYDVPIQEGYLHGYYPEIVSFIKNLFSNTLKTNDNIKFAIMTGVLRVSKESIFSDLNNVKVYSTMDETYDEYFGFTEDETEKLLKHYNLELTSEVKKMYNGYIFGNKEIYNPWSIINYASDKKLLPYWINTSGNELLQSIFDKTQNETKEMIEELILGKSIVCKYNEKVTFLDLDNIESQEANDVVANFLLVSGYLSKEKSDVLNLKGYIKVKIPNEEVRKIFVDVIEKWIGKLANVSTQILYELQLAMINGEKETLEKILNDALNHMSFLDVHENFYHGYMLGLFVGFLNEGYIVKSNREAGEGRFDIVIEAVDRSLGIIVEFKVAKDSENIEERAQKGKEQIKEKQYYREMELEKVQNILTYSIAFKSKHCKVV